VSKTVDTDVRNDDELVARLKQGQEAAYRILVRRFERRLYRVAYSITLDPEDSAEIVQEVFLKVYQHIHAFKGDSTLYTWMRRIAVNQSLNWKRRWRRRLKWHHQSFDKDDGYDSVDVSSDSRNPERDYLREEKRHLLMGALESLPTDARTVLMLKEIEGLSYEEIASTLGIKRGTVSSRIFYARQKLKSRLSRLLTPEEIDESGYR